MKLLSAARAWATCGLLALVPVLLVGCGGSSDAYTRAESDFRRSAAVIAISAAQVDIENAVLNGVPAGETSDLETYLRQKSQSLVDALEDSGLPRDEQRQELGTAIDAVLTVECDACEEILRSWRG